MSTNDFYEDWRFCSACRSYVRFLLSPYAAYCVQCGERVRLFSPRDLTDFKKSLSSKARSSAAPVSFRRDAELRDTMAHAVAE